MREHAYVRTVYCVVCGRGFSDDCGDAFCSSSCEREYEQEQEQECRECGECYNPEFLSADGNCDRCQEIIDNDL